MRGVFGILRLDICWIACYPFSSMRTRTGVIIFIIFFAILFGGAAYAWFLGSPSPRVLPQATVSIDTGEAWIQKAGIGEWLPVAADIPVAAGDHIKTGARSAAHITFFDTETARLDENAELVIQAADIDPDNTGKHTVTIRVLAGRVWSRIMKFTDRESSYTAHMSDVVATVRGTAFVMNAADPKGWLVHVVDSAVDVRLGADASTTQRIVAGDEAWVPKVIASTTLVESIRMERRGMTAARMSEDWFKQNEQLDIDFLQTMRTRRMKMMEKEVRILPGSFLYPVKLFGEKLRLALTSDGETRRDRVATLVRVRLYEQLLAPRHAPSDTVVANLLKKLVSDVPTSDKTARWCKRARSILGDYAATLRSLDASVSPASIPLPLLLAELEVEHVRVCVPSESATTSGEPPTSLTGEVIDGNGNTNVNVNTNNPSTNVPLNSNVNNTPNRNVNTAPSSNLNTNGVPIFFPPQTNTNQPTSTNTNTTNTNTTPATNANANTASTNTNQNTNTTPSNTNQNTNAAPATNNNTNSGSRTTPTNTNTTTAPTTNSNTTTSLFQPSFGSFNLIGPLTTTSGS
jgi:hypothetical protein